MNGIEARVEVDLSGQATIMSVIVGYLVLNQDSWGSIGATAPWLPP